MIATPVQTDAPVVSTETVMPGSSLLWLEAPEIARAARPGQFVMLKCEGDTLLRRPLSIHRVSADRTRVAFLFAIVGKGTAWLSALEPGDRVDLLGPLGNGFTIGNTPGGAVLVAGGLGIAPLGFLADELRAQGKEVSFLYGAATSDMLCPDRLLPGESRCVFATEDGSRGRKGYITACLPEYLSESPQIFACGPTPMYRTLARMSELKEKPVQVSLEVRMACGLGVCYGCTVNTRQGQKQVCKHGPVFHLHDILWHEWADI